MKGLAGRQPRGIPKGARLICIDNTGAKIVEVIEVPKYHGVHRRYPAAGIGDLLVVSVKKGTPQMRRQVINAVIVRMKRAFRRADGTMVQFDDNAVVLLSNVDEMRGTRIFGPVARELRDQYMKIVSLAPEVL